MDLSLPGCSKGLSGCFLRDGGAWTDDSQGYTGLGTVATFKQKSKSPGKFVVMTWVHGQARKLIGISGSVMVTRHSPLITVQFHSDEVELGNWPTELDPEQWTLWLGRSTVVAELEA